MTSPGEGRERELAAPQQQPRGRRPADTLANRLMLARKLAGLSIRDAADLCGIGRGAWTNWENGARPLDLLEITGIVAEKLDIELEWLRFGGPLESPRGRPVAKRVKKIGSPTGTRPIGPCTDRPKVRTHSRFSSAPTGPGRRAVVLQPSVRP